MRKYQKTRNCFRVIIFLASHLIVSNLKYLVTQPLINSRLVSEFIVKRFSNSFQEEVFQEVLAEVFEALFPINKKIGNLGKKIIDLLVLSTCIEIM